MDTRPEPFFGNCIAAALTAAILALVLMGTGCSSQEPSPVPDLDVPTVAATELACTPSPVAPAELPARDANPPQPTEVAARHAVRPRAGPTPVMEPIDAGVPAWVVSVLSGDTIEVTVGGKREKLTYLGIVAPALDEPLGVEARAANEALVGGRMVYLESDSQDRSRFHGLLRFVFLDDGTFVNAELVSLGYAEARQCLPDEKYWQLMRQLEKEAIATGRGLWSPESGYSRDIPCLDLTVSATSVEMGQPLTVTLTASFPRNMCAYAGSFLFRLDAQPNLFWVWVPLDAHNYTSEYGVNTGGRPYVTLRLQPLEPGRAKLMGNVQYEQHNILNFAGGYGACGSEPVQIEVSGQAWLQIPAQDEELTLSNVCRHNILFLAGGEEQPELWLMDPAGEQRVRLGYAGPRGAELEKQYRALRHQEAISPDGGYFAFPNQGSDSVQIFIQAQWPLHDPDQPAWQLTSLSGISYDPVWSPDGSRIAFVSQELGSDDIWLVNADGTGAKALTANLWEWDKHPSWSPDGQQIIFWSIRTGVKQIYVMDADGSNVRNISNTECDEYDPIWCK